MRTFATLLAGSAAGLLLAAGAAQAGVCSGEIMALQKQMQDTPTKASNSASMDKNPTRRRRDAPSDARTAISPTRAAPRANIKFARLTQASSKIVAVAAKKITSGVRAQRGACV